MKKHSLIFEEFACWGCRACETACKQEYNDVHEANSVQYLAVWGDGPRPMNGRLDFVWRVRVCKHCADPVCAKACPVEAIAKREDGIVLLDPEKCTGCRRCVEECPYGAIAFDGEKQLAIKCNLCHHRVDQGLYPACADNVCLAHCIYFGDPFEIEERISEKRKSRGG
jgi:Fe-S-cluster-containing dehydrogenase component